MDKYYRLIKNNPLTGWLEKIWSQLTEPSSEINALGTRRKARILSGLLLILIAFASISVLANISLAPGAAPTAEMVGTVLLFCVYLLSRSRHYYLTSTLLVFIYPIWTLGVLLSIDSQNVDRYLMGLLLSLFVGNLFLSIRLLAVLGVFNVMIIGVAIWLLPGGFTDLNVLPTTIIINIVATILMILSRLMFRRINRDKTELLQKSEIRFRHLAENNREVFRIYRPDQDRLEFVSSGIERVWGRRVGEFYEDRAVFLESILPEDREKIVKPMIDRQLQGETTYTEYRIVMPNGDIRWIYDRGFPIKDENGVVYQVLGFAEDITDRKNSEMDLKNSKERFLQLFYMNPDALVLTRARDGRIMEANDGFEQIFGFTSEEIGKGIFSARELYSKEADRPKLFKALEEDGRLKDYEIKVKDKKGNPLTILTSVEKIILDEEAYLLAAVRDVTEQRENEVKLTYHAYILENLSEGINYVDQNGYIQFTNPAFDNMFGYDPGELIGQHVSVLNDLPPEENKQFVSDIYQALHENGVWKGELKNRKKDGSQIITYSKVQDLTLGEESYWVTFQEDITERSRLEQQLRQIQKMESIGNLTAGIAHDFSNLLMSISISAEMLRLALKDNPNLMRKVVRILDSGQLAANLVNQLMIFSHKQILEPKIIDLNEVVNHISDLLRRVIGEHIAIEKELDSNLWSIQVDQTQIEQILVNLAVNARDAMVDGGTLSLKTRNVYLDGGANLNGSFQITEGKYVQLMVADTGIGMSLAVRKQIFEPFFTTKELGQGTGLGLATVYGIVEELKGDILVHSVEGVGTTFEIYIPMSEESITRDAPLSASQTLPGGTETILLVEDEEGIRIPIIDMLEMQGFTVMEAHDGQEALEVVRSHGGKIDLILTDVVMPRLSGKKMVDLLQDEIGEMKIIYMSGYNEEEISNKSVVKDGIDFVQKPVDVLTLLRKIRKVLDQ